MGAVILSFLRFFSTLNHPLLPQVALLLWLIVAAHFHLRLLSLFPIYKLSSCAIIFFDVVSWTIRPLFRPHLLFPPSFVLLGLLLGYCVIFLLGNLFPLHSCGRLLFCFRLQPSPVFVAVFFLVLLIILLLAAVLSRFALRLFSLSHPLFRCTCFISSGGAF